MDAMKHTKDFNPINSKGNEVESSHLQLDSIPSNSKSKENVESNHLQLKSSPSKAQSIVGEILLNGDAQVVDNHASNSGQCSYDNAQVVDNHTSNSRQCSYDPQVAYVGPSSSNSNNPFTYNRVTYYSYEAFEQDFHRQLIRKMQMDGVAPRDDDVNEPQFSNSIVFATGGTPAIINPHNGLPWRKGANLCRPYMDEGCCRFGTACIFHHPWPPTKD